MRLGFYNQPSDSLLKVTGWRAEPIAKALSRLVTNAKSRAKIKKVPFGITYRDLGEVFIAQRGLCFYSGREMDVFANGERKGMYRRLSISLDRLNPKLGYVASNICPLLLRHKHCQRRVHTF